MRLFLLALITLLCVSSASAQDAPGLGVQGNSWDVFLRTVPTNPDATAVIFIDLLTGDVMSVETSGERYTLIDGAVLYFDTADEVIKLVKPDGVVREHPFIVMSSADYRIDWTVSVDRQRIAWAVSRRTDDRLLTTSILVADSAGSQIRHLLTYGPREGIRLLPIAFSADGDSLYIDVHADGTERASPYARRSNMFVLDFSGDGVATRLLPGEAPCFCAVGFGEDVMLRLSPSGDADSTQVEIYDLNTGAERVISPVSRGDYDEAGNVLVSPDDAFAIYALTQGTGFRAADQELRTVLVLADIVNARQSVLGSAMKALARPIIWTEDSSAVLFALEGSDGTWKLQLGDGQAIQVADATYLGMLSEGAPE